MVTVQSSTCQPCSPCRKVSRTVSSTAAKNAYGIDPSSTPSRNTTPESGGAGSTRSPTVARNGLGSTFMISTAAPTPFGRSTWIVVDSRKSTSRPNSSASVAWMTSFCTSPYSDTEISRRSPSCRRSISGSCSASWVSAACRAPRSAGLAGTTTVSSVGGAKWRSAAPPRGLADRVADADVGQAPQRGDLTRRDRLLAAPAHRRRRRRARSPCPRRAPHRGPYSRRSRTRTVPENRRA